jgi:hypothetical protein
VCLEPGCGKEFIGHPIAKYCEFHRDISKRTRKVKEYEAVDVKNFIFKHGFTEVTNLELICQLNGCPNKYHVRIFPKQIVYPKFCEKHRTDYQRETFLKKKCLKLNTKKEIPLDIKKPLRLIDEDVESEVNSRTENIDQLNLNAIDKE